MDFLHQMEEGFCSCGLSCKDVFAPGSVVGLGVSGGADSMALLHGAVLLRKKFWGGDGAGLLVVSVNHNIRPPQESAFDAAFVEDFCSRLSHVQCRVVELPPGVVAETARNRGRGVEDAARFLRYEIFRREAAAVGCRHFLLAHTRNDQLETLLLRFLQGSGDEEGKGIPLVRDIFIRPLLNVSRQDIEEFLAHCQVEFRTDRTNFENGYLRNRCRNLLVPLLDREFPGWQKAVLAGMKKHRDDKELLSSLIPDNFWKNEDDESSLMVPWEDFFALHPALRRRVLFQALNRLGVNCRIPFRLVEKVAALQDGAQRGRIFSLGSMEVWGGRKGLVVRKIRQPEEGGFALLLESAGVYCIGGRRLRVAAGNSPSAPRPSLVIGGIEFLPPVVLRSLQAGDRAADDGRGGGAKAFSIDNEPDFRCVVEEVGRASITIISLPTQEASAI